jgi:RNA polymerase sigma factor (sigma-70 family)
VAAVLANVPGAFEAVVAAHQRLCWHIIYRIVRHPEDARELCQETFLRVYRYLPGYRQQCSLKAWIGRVAFNLALRHLEKKRASPVTTSLDESDEDHAGVELPDELDLEAICSNDQTGQRLRAAIEALPPLRRTVLTLYHLDEMPIAEIAQVTGLAEGTIKSHLCRTRLQLRRLLETHLGVDA